MATRETQALILDTALGLFNRNGSNAISTNRIAAECGISRGNLHYHFHNKAEIVQSIFGRIVGSMNNGSTADHLDPTLKHMTEMFVRQSLLIHKFEFFYREMTTLLPQDELLFLRYREHREKRLVSIEQFFLALKDNGTMNFGPDPAVVASLLTTTWIICDSWPNFVEFQGIEFNAGAICQGYDLILRLLAPYITIDINEVTKSSHQTIYSMLAEMSPNKLTSAN
ncbi:MAG: TetR/AcrR family transcriptional regulator [Xanthomonadales bacterium]|nr:TetR/AcrR family transcriptional regulator [Xanthomonadales bacterium]